MSKQHFVTNIPAMMLGLTMLAATACQASPAPTPTPTLPILPPQLVPAAAATAKAGFHIGGWT